MSATVEAGVPRRDVGSLGSRVAANVWIRFIVRRLLGLVVGLAALLCVVFFLIHLVPGNPAINALGLNSTPSAVARIDRQIGYNKPIFDQLGTYLDHLVHGNLGSSFITNQPVTQILSQGLNPSLQLAGLALLLVMAVSIPLGLLAGALTQEGRHRRLEFAFTTITSIGGAIPDFLTATVLAFLFAVEFRLFPAAGSGSFAQLVLPALAVAAGPIWILARLVRLETLNVLAQDYIRTAHSQRLPWFTVYGRHVLPNVLTAALTISGLLFANLIGGAVIVENVFNRQGLGTELVNAVLNKELVVVEGIALLLGAFILVVIVLVDVLLSIIDPRSLARGS